MLADVFQSFRKTCMGSYKLDLPQCYTAPGLSWDALLNYTGINLELLTDIDMHLFIEKGMRGGISMVSKRHAKSNNPHTVDYDPGKENNYTMHYDANNLHGWAMSQSIIHFQVETEKRRPNGTSHILEVDLEYPQHLHKSHKAYPLAQRYLP